MEMSEFAKFYVLRMVDDTIHKIPEFVPIMIILLLIEVCLFKKQYYFSAKTVLYAFLCEGFSLLIDFLYLIFIDPIDAINLYCDFFGLFLFGFITAKNRKIISGLKFTVFGFILKVYIYYSLNTSISLIINNNTYIDKLTVLYWNRYVTAFYILYIIICLFILFSLYFGMYKRNILIKLNWKQAAGFVVYIILILLSVVSILGNVFNHTGFSDNPQNVFYGYTETIVQTILGFYMLFSFVFAPVLLLLATTGIISRNEHKKQEELIQSQIDYIKQYKRNQEDTRAFRHDIKNNLAAINMILENKNIQEAQDYINNLLGTIATYTQKYACGNDMLDCIISMKAEVMKANGIQFVLDGKFENGLQLENPDICTIFANAFDNAIEASMKIPEASKRNIEMKIKHTDNFYKIAISNRINAEENGTEIQNSSDTEKKTPKRFTTKADPEMHGFGIGNMKKSVEKYNGILNTEVKENKFILSIILRTNK